MRGGSFLFLLWSVHAENVSLDGFKLRGGNFKHDLAKAYNISEPVYTCPKPGYELVGEECIFEDSVPARFECPIGYERVGPICRRRAPPNLSCPAGSRLQNGVCRDCTLTNPQVVCPPNTDKVGETCVRTEEVEPVERCPEGSSRVGRECILIEYHDPRYVCPPDTIPEGRSCRRETINFKNTGRKDKRILAAIEDEDTEFYPEVDDIPARVFESHDVEGSCAGGDKGCAGTWLPAVKDHDGLKAHVQPPLIYKGLDREAKAEAKAAAKAAEKEAKAAEKEAFKEEREFVKQRAHDHDGKYGDGKYGEGKYGKYGDKRDKKHDFTSTVGPTVPPPTTTGVPTTTAARKPKTRIEVVKGPTQVIKVQTYPAEKLCDIGDRHGGVCVLQTVVPPVEECPVPETAGRCIRRVVVPPLTSCPGPVDEPADLVCPPQIPGTRCQCERCRTFPPIRTCPGGVLDGRECVYEAPPKPYCPIGYFIDETICRRRDVEAALCLFNVTYVCPDCDLPKHKKDE